MVVSVIPHMIQGVRCAIVIEIQVQDDLYLLLLFMAATGDFFMEYVMAVQWNLSITTTSITRCITYN